jgi:hypothetical protein
MRSGCHYNFSGGINRLTDYYNKRNKWRTDKDTPISVRNYENDEPKTYYCNTCNRTLNKLIDSSGENPAYFCNTCRTEVIPSLTEVRSKSKIVTPDGPIEQPSVSTKFPEPTIGRQPAEPKGLFKFLRDRGMKITNYRDEVKE